MDIAKPTKTKLTLSIQTDLVAYGKRLARERGTSLSAILQEHLLAHRRQEEAARADILSGKRFADVAIPRHITALRPVAPDDYVVLTPAEEKAAYYGRDDRSEER